MGLTIYYDQAELAKHIGYVPKFMSLLFHFLVLFLPVFLKILTERIGNSTLSLVEKIDFSILKVRFFNF